MTLCLTWTAFLIMYLYVRYHGGKRWRSARARIPTPGLYLDPFLPILIMSGSFSPAFLAISADVGRLDLLVPNFGHVPSLFLSNSFMSAADHPFVIQKKLRHMGWSTLSRVTRIFRTVSHCISLRKICSHLSDFSCLVSLFLSHLSS